MTTAAQPLTSTRSLHPKLLSALREHVQQATLDPQYWMERCTRTLDEQDNQNPYKPFPHRAYFKDLNQAWDAEKILLVEKSRTAMCTWWAAARSLHLAMTRPATRVLLIAQDEMKSLVLLKYCWTLYEQQEPIFKQLWPLDRPQEKQSYNVLELKRDSSMIALPGKDAGKKIRSEHPTLIVFDEAAFIEDFHGAMNSAISTRAEKIVAITSAEPGDFREITRDAEAVEWPYA